MRGPYSPTKGGSAALQLILTFVLQLLAQKAIVRAHEHAVLANACRRVPHAAPFGLALALKAQFKVSLQA